VDTLGQAGCASVIVVVPEPLLDRARALLDPGVTLIAGGPTRQQSVHNGLKRISADRVVVHDAVRPFISVELVRSVVEALDRADAAIAAVPLDETLKGAEGGYVTATVDRTGMWRAQTPQAFHARVLRRAHELAGDEGFDATDDAQLVERYGGRVAIVAGSKANIKLTYPEDFELAEALMRSGR
jgi:2-C-methyl-D-erythritol 4-phosphate cytidylyltransferase